MDLHWHWYIIHITHTHTYNTHTHTHTYTHTHLQPKCTAMQRAVAQKPNASCVCGKVASNVTAKKKTKKKNKKNQRKFPKIGLRETTKTNKKQNNNKKKKIQTQKQNTIEHFRHLPLAPKSSGMINPCSRAWSSSVWRMQPASHSITPDTVSNLCIF